MRQYHTVGILLVLSGGLSNPSFAEVDAQDTSSPDPLNIVVFFTDDQGWGDLGCQGAVGIPTPNIDRLAAEGVRFTNFYTAQPVCSASRSGEMGG